MISDRKESVWVGMPRAISRINGGLVNETFFDISSRPVRYLMEPSDSNIWLPTRPGLYRYDQDINRQSLNDPVIPCQVIAHSILPSD